MKESQTDRIRTDRGTPCFIDHGDALVREWTERDYGIVFVLGLFNNGTPTGKHSGSDRDYRRRYEIPFRFIKKNGSIDRQQLCSGGYEVTK